MNYDIDHSKNQDDMIYYTRLYFQQNCYHTSRYLKSIYDDHGDKKSRNLLTRLLHFLILSNQFLFPTLHRTQTYKHKT